MGYIDETNQYIQAANSNGGAALSLALNPYGGNVGIGSSSPNSKLEIVSSISNDGINFKYNSSIGNTRIGTVFDTGSDAGNALIFSVSNAVSVATERMRISGNGFVYTPGTYANTSGGAANVGVGADGGLYRSTSSLRYKKNIEDYTRDLEDVMKLRPVMYESINEREAGVKYSGFIAEEVDALGLKEFVQYDSECRPDAITYSQMVSLLTKAIQEQQVQIEELKKRVDELSN